MKASEAQQADLLSLANLDQEISRSRAAIKNLSSGAQFASLRETQRELAAKLINARNALDTVELELKRSETDLELVEQRITKDVARLNSTNNAKDAQGIQSELESLKKRKSDLEDIELAILEQKEESAAAFATVAADKASVDEELSAGEAKNEAEIMKLRSGLDLLTNDRAQQASRIPVAFLLLACPAVNAAPVVLAWALLHSTKLNHCPEMKSLPALSARLF